MTTKKSVRGLIVTVALCLSATAGRAQDKEFFLMGGGASLSDKRSFSEAYIPFGSAFSTGGKGIAGIEMPLKKSKTFGIEGSYGFGQNNLKLTNYNTTPAAVTAYGLRTNRLSGDLVAHAPSSYHGVRPYAVFGLEYNLFSPTSAAKALGTSEGFAFEKTAKLGSQGAVGVNFGGGFEWRGSSRLGLRIDVRDHITTSPTFGLPTTEPSTTGLAWFPTTGNARNIEYSLGIVYHFGRKEAPTPAPQAPPSPRPSSRRPSSSEPWPTSPPPPF
jgi:hypothetical protein